MTDHSSSSPSTTTPPTADEAAYQAELGGHLTAVGLHEIPGMIQQIAAVWVPERGWLTAKRSIIYGGRHGQAPMTSLDENLLLQITQIESRTAVRAILARLRKERVGELVETSFVHVDDMDAHKAAGGGWIEKKGEA